MVKNGNAVSLCKKPATKAAALAKKAKSSVCIFKTFRKKGGQGFIPARRGFLTLEPIVVHSNAI